MLFTIVADSSLKAMPLLAKRLSFMRSNTDRVVFSPPEGRSLHQTWGQLRCLGRDGLELASVTSLYLRSSSEVKT